MTLEIGATLAERYRVDEAVGPGVYRGTDTQADVTVRLVTVAAEVAEKIESLRHVAHAHLAKILDFVKSDDKPGVLVVEHVAGATLAEKTEPGERDTIEAVRAALRIADALSHVHDAGGIHGCVSAEAVVLTPEGRPDTPLLSYYPSAEGSHFQSPARRGGSPPSEGDDAWAGAAILHQLLCGKAPPPGGFASPDELFTADIADDALRTALFHALNADEKERSGSLRPLKRELARWFVEHSDEEAPSPGHMSSLPPPLPPGSSLAPPSGGAASLRPSVRASRAPDPKKSRSRLAVFAGSAIVIGLLAAWSWSMFGSKKNVKYLTAAKATESAEATPEPIALGDVPVTGEQGSGGNEMASCVAGYLPKGAFGTAPDLSFVCSETNPEKGSELLRTAVVTGAPKGGAPTEAMAAFARLGWYGMAAFSVVRAGCCVDAAPLSLPEASKGCDSMSAPLQSLGPAVVSGQPHDELLTSFEKAVTCEVDSGHGNQFRGSAKPAKTERVAFEALVGGLKE